jgi:hypothetical protein
MFEEAVDPAKCCNLRYGRQLSRGAFMTTLFVHHRVADYNTWRPEFDRAVQSAWTKEARSYRVWRGLDDPNLVIVANTFESRQAAEAMMNNPLLREAMGRGGVIQNSVRVDLVDEVAAGTR